MCRNLFTNVILKEVFSRCNMKPLTIIEITEKKQTKIQFQSLQKVIVLKYRVETRNSTST